MKGARTIVAKRARAWRPVRTTPDGKPRLEVVSCIGACDQAPAMLVNDRLFGNLTQERIRDILQQDALHAVPPASDGGRRASETPIVLQNCGVVDPRDIASYMERGGFRAFVKARRMKPQQIVDEIKRSGLTGRGGAGFNCGLKWELAQKGQSREEVPHLQCRRGRGRNFQGPIHTHQRSLRPDRGDVHRRPGRGRQAGLHLPPGRISLPARFSPSCHRAGAQQRASSSTWTSRCSRARAPTFAVRNRR